MVLLEFYFVKYEEGDPKKDNPIAPVVVIVADRNNKQALTCSNLQNFENEQDEMSNDDRETNYIFIRHGVENTKKIKLVPIDALEIDLDNEESINKYMEFMNSLKPFK